MEFTLKAVRDQLRKRYSCYAHFYTLAGIACRRQLEVIDKNITPFSNGITTNMPDATLIMANPGTAKPFQPCHSFKETEFIKVDDEQDQTLWRVKELMKEKDWRHVRVINLSDLRAGNDEYYIDMRNEFQNKFNNDSHSLFSAQREQELDAILAYNGMAPIILAWGLKNQAQKEFADLCSNKVAKLPNILLGMQNQKKSGYYHPLAPRWVCNI